MIQPSKILSWGFPSISEQSKARDKLQQRSYFKGHKLYVGEYVFTAESLLKLTDHDITKANSNALIQRYESKVSKNPLTENWIHNVGMHFIKNLLRKKQ